MYSLHRNQYDFPLYGPVPERVAGYEFSFFRYHHPQHHTYTISHTRSRLTGNHD
jgi:hypothetical protein